MDALSINLTITERKGVAGIFACSFLHVIDGSEDRKWSCETFRALMHDFLKLSASEFEAFLPLLQNTTAHEEQPITAAPFVEIVQKESCEPLLKSILWLFVPQHGYDARTRTLVRVLAKELHVPWSVVTQQEKILGVKLFAELKSMVDSNRGTEKRNFRDWKRNAKIGVAAVGGAALMGLTAGFAAPALAAGFTALGGTGVAVGTAVASASGVAATTAFFGAAGAGLAGYKVDRRTSKIGLFQFKLETLGNEMNLFICVSGWLEQEAGDPDGSDFDRPWGSNRQVLRAFYKKYNPDKLKEVDSMLKRYRGREDELFAQLRQIYDIKTTKLLETDETSTLLTPAEANRAWRWKDKIQSGDKYHLLWDEQGLRRFGSAINSFVTNKAMEYAYGAAVKQTVFSALYAAAALPMTIIKAADLIDSEWAMALEHADEAGKILAAALLEREQGNRPVTLVGYSMGARLIYSCLKVLNQSDAGCGIVENAVLLGSPVSLNAQEWTELHRVVSGRLINGYSTNDWVLAVMYRFQGMAINVCGTCAIASPGIENLDLSDVIKGHLEYRNKIGMILERIELE